jgi:YfiR/HmsC-like
MRIKFLALLIFVGLVTVNAFSQTTNYKAHTIFVFSIAKYSQWPANDNSEFVITVLGKSKLYDELIASSANHTISGKKISVITVNDVAEIKETNMVLVSDGKSSALPDLIKATANQPIMIVTEREGLHKKGAGVSFFVNDAGKLNFDLNLTEMNKRTLTLSKSLTSLAASIL